MNNNNNNNLILFILVICVIYLLYKVNKKEGFANNATDEETITITESIKNLGLIAKRIQEGNGNVKFPANLDVDGNLDVTGDSEFSNITIPLGGKITFKGPGGKSSEIFYNNTTSDGLEIAQRGASKLRLFQNHGGFDFTHDSITKYGSSKLRLKNGIVSDSAIQTKDEFKLIDDTPTGEVVRGRIFKNTDSAGKISTYIESAEGNIQFENDIKLPLGKKIRFGENENTTIEAAHALFVRGASNSIV